MIRWLKRKTGYGFWRQGNKHCHEFNLGRVRVRIGTYETSISIDEV